MKLSKTRIVKLSDQVVKHYRHFQQQAGAHSIATPVSLEILFDLCQQLKPQRILEIGGGIGTISTLLLSNSEALLDIYEDHIFCQQKLKENLSKFSGRYLIIDDYRWLPPAKNYDLIIVDGGDGKSSDGGFASAVWHYLQYLDSVKVVYIEGQRHYQRLQALKVLSRKYTFKLQRFFVDHYDKLPFTSQKPHGGLIISCQASRSLLLRKINYLFWVIVEWYPIKYAFKYRTKGIKQRYRALAKHFS